MKDKKKKIALNDDLLDKVSGGAFNVGGNSTHRIQDYCRCDNSYDGGRDADGRPYCGNCGGLLL